MELDTATTISIVSLTFAIASPFLAYWRVHIEYLKLSKKDTSKQQKLITDLLSLYARMTERSKIMLLVITERKHQLLQEQACDDMQQHLQILEKLENKLYKRINKTSSQYEKVAAMRQDNEWDEHWLRAEIDKLVISHRNHFIYDNPAKELSAFCAAGISASMLQERVLNQPAENVLSSQK